MDYFSSHYFGIAARNHLSAVRLPEERWWAGEEKGGAVGRLDSGWWETFVSLKLEF